MKYNIFEPWKTLDSWQKEYIETEGDCFLSIGRQSGKTAAMSIKIGKKAAENPNRIIGCFAYTEKQAYALFFKTLMYLKAKYPKSIIYGKDKPTKHVINLKNNSKIMCYAVGIDGSGIRTFTLTDLFIDEAAAMAREVFIALRPMLSVTGGHLDISSTARGKHNKDGTEKYFYSCSKDKKFKKFYISAEDCPRHTKQFLADERARMTKLEYAQEYLSLFLDEVRQFFPDELIKHCIVTQENSIGISSPYLGDTTLGVDIARMGKDETVLLSLNRNDTKDRLNMIDMEVTTKTLLTDTVRLILNKDEQYNYRKIYIDTGGLGVGVFDPLLEHNQTKRKVISINNASKSIEYRNYNETQKTRRLLKEDLYLNLKNLMEKGMIKLFKDDDIFASLQSIQYEDEDGKVKIWGSYSHITEALVRAAWYIKDRKLKPYIN